MPFFWKKEKAIITKIEHYLEETDNCRDRFLECVTVFVNQESFKPNSKLVKAIHFSESRADDIRREIEYELYNKALVPESREDILFLLESFDTIPNSFESICFELSIENITVPDKMKSGMLTMIHKNLEAYSCIRNAFQGLFYKKELLSEIEEIDSIESEVDRQQRKLLKQLFELPIEKADKILFKDIIKRIAGISDLAQEVSDRLSIAIIKRRL